ncbi:MAG: cytochrome b N-terminal domain-containing protein [Candidatus Hermodarchaeia archaeon]|jgi:quinol-cytochrome oxidoreductase complex cytochrome b subunit
MLRTIFEHLDERLRIQSLGRFFAQSTPPDHIPISKAPPFSLGRIALILAGLLGLSGIALTLFYEPTAQRAAASLVFLHRERPLGWLIHNTHRWSAFFLTIIVVLHALRVWVKRAFQFPRDINWWLGLALLITILIMGGTGYLLRWDIKAFALMDLVISNLSSIPILGPILITIVLGGTELNVIPLQRGYTLHVWFLPFTLLALIITHILISWRQGLLEPSQLWENLKSRLPKNQRFDMIPGLLILIIVLVLSSITPHDVSAGPVDRSALPHPDWILMFYFLPFWFFKGSTRLIGTLIIPSLLITFLILAPKLARIIISRYLLPTLIIVGVLGVAWMFGQVSYMNYRVPLQGCNACHRETIEGGAPTDLTEFDIRDPDWLVQHLKEPLESIFEPSAEPQTLP